MKFEPRITPDTFSSRQVFVLVFLTVGGYTYSHLIFGSGTKLSVTDGNQKRTTQAPRVHANTQQSPTRPAAGPRVHVDVNSSLLCVPPAMFPPLVQLSCKRQKKNGGEPEELELRESGRNASILLIHQNSTYKCNCYVKHKGGTVEAQTQQEVPAPAASCPPEREPADLPALQPADLSFQSQCRVKLLCLLYTVLIVKSLVYCCGLSLLMSLTNKGASTNCTHAD
ncbi:uncharacterized protein LOC120434144 [Oreochromis aureus]|uniref:uncharacterized protein LOC120434144 n=1 Tax=Oreochromis aureus TaxID=47969 RepID=UPI001954AD2A|nr:uncharacterized protein LOC120434144 [Oreochromis aureus]